MFYSIARVLVRLLVALINGNTRYQNKAALPDGPYVLVGPHRTWWDPIMFALAASPRKFGFMAKEELFHKPVLRWILTHANAFGVDRAHPGPSAIKTPVKQLRKGDLSVIMFPTGSRYSTEMRGGAILIAQLARVPLVPAVYQGPLTFGGVLARKRMTVRFGAPIEPPKGKITEATTKEYAVKMQTAFDAIDKAIDPSFKYIPDQQKYLKEKKQGKV